MTSTSQQATGVVVGTLRSVNVGMPKDVPWNGAAVHTGIYKTPVEGPITARRLNLDGDGQGDLGGHGGEQRAVLLYQLDSYAHWAQYLKRDDLNPGIFGENFTVDGVPDADVCIGDRFAIGTAVFEVTQPRVTCYRIGMRMGEPQMAALLVGHRRPGFYLRVITEGEVKSGDDIRKISDGPHRLSVADIDGLLYLPNRDPALLKKAVDVPALSPGWQQSFRELIEGGSDNATAVGPTFGKEPAWDGFRKFVVERAVAETPEVTSFYLSADNDARLDPPEPGQYLTVRVAGAGTPAPVRTYSISAVPDSHTYRISVKREEHGLVSKYLHDHVVAGMAIEAAAPRGEFILATDPEPVVLLSAGVGATPVLAMLDDLAKRASTTPVWWIQVAHNADEQPFRSEVERTLKLLPNSHYVIFYTRPLGGSKGLHPGTPELAALGLPTNARAYLCGPDAFMDQMTASLGEVGLAASKIQSERFGTQAAINPGVVGRASVPVHQPPGPPGIGPAVTFTRSGITVNWREQDTNLLELAEACDVPTRWSCRTGVCHTCVTPIIDGDIDYQPAPLELPPTGQILVCCARPRKDLTLDA